MMDESSSEREPNELIDAVISNGFFTVTCYGKGLDAYQEDPKFRPSHPLLMHHSQSSGITDFTVGSRIDARMAFIIRHTDLMEEFDANEIATFQENIETQVGEYRNVEVVKASTRKRWMGLITEEIPPKYERRFVNTGSRQANIKDLINTSHSDSEAAIINYEVRGIGDRTFPCREGRVGNTLGWSAVLPLEIARRFWAEVPINPKIFRVILEKVMAGKFIGKASWDGAMPPFEEWKKQKGGKERLILIGNDIGRNDGRSSNMECAKGISEVIEF